jgi:hypothetical protein
VTTKEKKTLLASVKLLHGDIIQAAIGMGCTFKPLRQNMTPRERRYAIGHQLMKAREHFQRHALLAEWLTNCADMLTFEIAWKNTRTPKKPASK